MRKKIKLKLTNPLQIERINELMYRRNPWQIHVLYGDMPVVGLNLK
jgi:hypothetical protein